MKLLVRNQFVEFREKTRPVLVQTRKKKAGKQVELLVRKGYLRREKRRTGEFEPVATVTIDTDHLRKAVFKMLHEYAVRTPVTETLVAVANPRYFGAQIDMMEAEFGMRFESRSLSSSDRRGPQVLGVDVYFWSGIDTVIFLPKSIFFPKQ